MITYFSVTHYANLASADILIEPNNQHYAVTIIIKILPFFTLARSMFQRFLGMYNLSPGDIDRINLFYKCPS